MTDNYKSPTSRPPYYRVVDAPLLETVDLPHSEEACDDDFLRLLGPAEGPCNWTPHIDNNVVGSVQHPKNSYEHALNLFDRCYHWIELERLSPERVLLTDQPAPAYHGPTDRFGRAPTNLTDRPVRPKFDTKQPPTRVLLWSRLGFDRPCAAVAAYLMRRWNMSLNNAILYIKRSRVGLKISEFNLRALKIWEKKYTVGNYVCKDCLSRATRVTDSLQADARSLKEHILSLGSASSLLLSIDKFVSHFVSPIGNVSRIIICGAELADADAVTLAEALWKSGVICNLHTLILNNNAISDAGVAAFGNAFNSPETSKPPRAAELVVLDFSFNR